jgi:hypothetical protein
MNKKVLSKDLQVVVNIIATDEEQFITSVIALSDRCIGIS